MSRYHHLLIKKEKRVKKKGKDRLTIVKKEESLTCNFCLSAYKIFTLFFIQGIKSYFEDND